MKHSHGNRGGSVRQRNENAGLVEVETEQGGGQRLKTIMRPCVYRIISLIVGLTPRQYSSLRYGADTFDRRGRQGTAALSSSAAPESSGGVNY